MCRRNTFESTPFTSIAKNPKVFICHAGEDKERFVLPFAEDLRAKGVDAWVSKWELLGGDSLVEKIFEEAIGHAQAIIIVLSQHSVQKPWVRKELNTAVVKNIEEGFLLIPVLIDDVLVPVVLKETYWIRVKDIKSYDDELEKVIRAIYGESSKPPLGEPPGYIRLPFEALPSLTTTDTLVLKLACETDRAGEMVEMKYLKTATEDHDIGSDALLESVRMLEGQSYAKPRWTGGGGIGVLTVTSTGYIEYARAFVDGFEGIVDRVAYSILNTSTPNSTKSDDIADDLDLDRGLVGRIVEMMDLRGWVDAVQVGGLGGTYIIQNASVEMKRAYRS